MQKVIYIKKRWKDGKMEKWKNVKSCPFWQKSYKMPWPFVAFSLPLQRRKDKELSQIMKQSELQKRLRDAGCILSQHGSRHDKWINPKTGAFEYVPRHSKEVAKGLALKVLKNLAGE